MANQRRRYRQTSLIGKLGSLNTGAVATALDPTESPVSRNIERPLAGAIRCRSGQQEMVRLAAHPPVNWAWGYDTVASPDPLLLSLTGSGGFTAGDYEVVASYVTAAGETDTAFARVVTITATEGKCISAMSRFHMRDKRIRLAWNEGGVTKFSLYEGPSQFWSADAYAGYEVYSRDPRIQDESGLGMNPRRDPLYNRAEPLALVASFDAPTGVFTLDRIVSRVELLSYIDIMMPDRAGLPIRAVNLYARASGDTDFYYVGTMLDERPITFSSIDTSQKKAPSTRVDRSAPVLTAGSVMDIDPRVKQRNIVTATGIEGGVWMFRYCWRSASSDLIDAPGFTPRPRSVPVELWPSAAAFVSVVDGQGITITLPDTPEGCTDAVVYGKRMDVDEGDWVTFSGVLPGDTGQRLFYHDLLDVILPATPTWSPSSFRADNRSFEPDAAGYTSIATMGDGDSLSIQGNATTNVVQVECPGALLTGAENVNLVLEFQVLPPTGVTTYTAGNQTGVKIEYWDQSLDGGNGAWVELVTGIGVEDGMASYSLSIPYDPAMLDSDGYLAAHINAWGKSVDLEIGHAHFEPFISPADSNFYYSDVIPSETELYQDEGEEEIVLKRPMNESLGAIITNTTGQWPIENFKWPIEKVDSSRFRYMAGCLDSLFILRANGWRRVYQYEGDVDPGTKLPTLEVGKFNWEMAFYEDRALICHPAVRENLVFDLVCVRKWGLESPPEGNPGTITILEIAGEVDGEYGWWARYDRLIDRPDGQYSYNVHSGLAFVGEVRNADNATVRLRVRRPEDPSVTHVTLCRPITGGTTLYKVAVVPVDGTVTSDGFIEIIDNKPDGDLAYPVKRETGAPPSAALVAVYESRAFVVPKDRPLSLAFSNISDEDGNPDPEGFTPRNEQVPKMPEGAQRITALAPYASGLVCHSIPGPVLATILSDSLEGQNAVAYRRLYGGGGAVGSKAWANADTIQPFLSVAGPSIIEGDLVKPIHAKVKGTWESSARDDESFRFARVWHYRSEAKHQVGFSFSTSPSVPHDRALVLHLPDAQSGEVEWSEWSDFPAHSVVVTMDPLGYEYPMVGDHLGRTHRADIGGTDNGRFISWRHETADLDVSGSDTSEAFRFLAVYFKQEGINEFVLLDLYFDMGTSARHETSYRLDVADPGYRWDDDTLEWDEEGLDWDDTDTKRMVRKVLAIGGRATRIRIGLHQTWDLMPVGHQRESIVELAGFVLASEPRFLSPTPTAVREG